MTHYVITGSTGHISKPIALGLIKAGKKVTIVTSNKDKVKEIEALGAKAAVGSVQDPTFLKSTFKGAEVVYTMIPPIWQTSDWRASQLEVAHNYADAIKANGIKHVVNLSSVGAHHGEGVGPVNAMHDFEQLLDKIEGLNVKHLRPASFYYNLFNQIGLIRSAGIMGANYGDGDKKIALVHTDDIAKAALEELIDLNFKGNSVRNIVGDLRTGKDVAKVLGKAIGKEIPWVVFTDEQQKEGLLQAGLPESHVGPFTEMGAAIRTGKMQEEILDKSTNGAIKLEDFAKEFAAAYNVG